MIGRLRKALGGTLKNRRIANAEAAGLAALAEGVDYHFVVHYQKSANDLLSQLCDKYGSDKGEVRSSGHPYTWPSHTYADLYSRLFSHCRNSVRNVFECGLGTNNPDVLSSMGVAGKPGASLRMWRDYFPNATIYGADIDRDILFREDRIETFYVDQLDPVAVAEYWKTVGATRFDFMLDDGLHTFEAGRCLYEGSIGNLAADGVYIIEDVKMVDLLKFKDYFRGSDKRVDYVTMFRPGLPLRDNSVIVIRN